MTPEEMDRLNADPKAQAWLAARRERLSSGPPDPDLKDFLVRLGIGTVVRRR